MELIILNSEILRASRHYLTKRLKFSDFKRLTGISLKRVQRHYDNWTEACRANDLEPGPTGRENLKPNYGPGKEYYERELRRVAAMVSPGALNQKLLFANVSFTARPIRSHWGSITNAFKELGIPISPKYHEALPLETLASDFVSAVQSLRNERIPSVVQLARRSGRSQYCYSEKFGGYPKFKKAAIEFLLAHRFFDPATQSLLQEELKKVGGTADLSAATSRTHFHGKMLGFRAFAYVPTYENEVVQLFGAIAQELGFQIATTRNEFPDCKALRKIPSSRRDRWKDCLIEFELNSSDFKAHKHPIDQCDLIVCWEHDWKDCPLETLELKSAIQSLSGWQEK